MFAQQSSGSFCPFKSTFMSTIDGMTNISRMILLLIPTFVPRPQSLNPIPWDLATSFNINGPYT
jgi:hypothetical protein